MAKVVVAQDADDDGLWDEIDRELDDVATPPLSPWQSRPSTRPGNAEPEAEQLASGQADAACAVDDGQEGYMAGMERLEQAANVLARTEGRGKVRKLEPDPDCNHVLDMEEEGGPPRVIVKDTVAIRAAFLQYCNSRMRPPELQRMLEHGMAGPCLTAPKLMALCNELGLWQPKGPLSFLVVGAIFSNLKNDEVQGLLYPDFLQVLAQLALESRCNVAAQLQEMHAPKPQAPLAKTKSHGKLDPHVMHSVEDLVAGLPPVATQRIRQLDLAATGQLQLPPLPGPPPERFARIVPLLRSPSLGRLFTHAQIRELGQALGGGGGGGHQRRLSSETERELKVSIPGSGSGAASPAHSAHDGGAAAGGAAPVAIVSPSARGSRAGADADAAQASSAPNKNPVPRPGLNRCSPSNGLHRKPPLLPTISARSNALRSSVPNTPSILAAAAAGANPEPDSAQSTPSHPLHSAALAQSLMWSRFERRSDPGLGGSGAPSPCGTRPSSKRSQSGDRET